MTAPKYRPRAQLAYWMRTVHQESHHVRLAFTSAWKSGKKSKDWEEHSVDPNSQETWAHILTRSKANVFVSPAQCTGDTDDDFVSSTVVWADVDAYTPEQRREWRNELKPQAEALGAMIVSSGRGYHVYVCLDEPLKDAEKLRRLNQGLCARFHGDPALTSPSRVLRVPGSYHRKSDRAIRVRLVRKPRRWWSQEDLERELSPDLARAPTAPRPAKLDPWKRADISRVSPGLRFQIEQKALDTPVGKRSDACNWAVMTCREKGLTRDQTHTLLDQFSPGVERKGDWHRDIDRIWAKSTPLLAPSQSSSDDGFEEAGSRLILRRASTIPIDRVRWGWQDRMPVGEITLIPGREGTGKSTLLAWMAAMITNGTMPGEFFGQKRAVLYMASEDAWNYTIAPRMVAAGADLNLVYQVSVEKNETGIVLPDDCDELIKASRSVKAAAWMMDPILSYVDSNINVNQSQQLRRALEPLKNSAEEAGTMAIALAHFNKAVETDLLSKIPGSRAWAEVARAVLGVVKDGDEPRYIVSTVKNNLGMMDLPNLTYTLESCLVPTHDGESANVGRLKWGENSERSVEQVMSSEKAQGRPVGQAYREIVDYVVNDGGRLKVADIAEFFDGVIKPATVRRYLARAEERGDLARPGAGLYSKPYQTKPTNDE